jgi:hypothetical protein
MLIISDIIIICTYLNAYDQYIMKQQIIQLMKTLDKYKTIKVIICGNFILQICNYIKIMNSFL